MSRDYKDEYKKFQSSDQKKKYRAKLNKYNRDKGTYGNGDGKDASHKNGKILGFVDSSSNKGKKEKSRMKGSTRKIKKAQGGKLGDKTNYYPRPKFNEMKPLKTDQHALGGKIGGKSPEWSEIIHGQYVMPYNQEYMDKEEGGKINSFTNGGLAEGPSHDDGGIPGIVRSNGQRIEFEGGEIIVNKNKNDAAGKHEDNLLKLNENPDEYEIVKKETKQDYPVFNAKDRRA